MINPVRGEIYRANLEPARGTEIKGIARPILIIQNNDITKYVRSVIAIPFTKNIKRKEWPFTVLVEKNEDNGLEEDSVLLCHQMGFLEFQVLPSEIETRKIKKCLRPPPVLPPPE